MSSQRIQELDIEITIKVKELNTRLSDFERLAKAKEVFKLYDEQNNLLNQQIENSKKSWKQPQIKN